MMKIQLMAAQAIPHDKVLNPILPPSIEEAPSLAEPEVKAATEPSLLQCTQEMEGQSAEQHLLYCNDPEVEGTLVIAPQGSGGHQECPPPVMVQVSSNGLKHQVQATKTTNELLSLEHDNPIQETALPTEPDPIISSGIIIEPIGTSVATDEDPALKLKGKAPQENPDLSIFTDPTELSLSDKRGGRRKDSHDHHEHIRVHIGLGLATTLMLIAMPSAAMELPGGSERLTKKRSRRHSFQFQSHRSSLFRRRHSAQQQNSELV